jgi:hypothetical protein
VVIYSVLLRLSSHLLDHQPDQSRYARSAIPPFNPPCRSGILLIVLTHLFQAVFPSVALSVGSSCGTLFIPGWQPCGRCDFAVAGHAMVLPIERLNLLDVGRKAHSTHRRVSSCLLSRKKASLGHCCPPRIWYVMGTIPPNSAICKAKLEGSIA